MGRRLAFGAEAWVEGGVDFRVWAPGARRVDVVVDGGVVPLTPEGAGWHSGWVADAGPGSLYRYRLDGRGPFSDPASRFQPDGPHGPSQVVDPAAFSWTDGAWPGPALGGQVIYEMHVGSFTPDGTWAAAAEWLGWLKDLGITTIEMMPVAEFPGRFGWGYDGVDLFAPTHLYGRPDDLRAFIDRAHRIGLAVILDVVYNHLGPDGNFLAEFSPRFFTDRYENEWGEAIDFERPGSGPVRDFFSANAAYWVEEFHFDGLRLDATQSMFDSSAPHILAEIAGRVRSAAGARQVLLVAENEPQQVRLLADYGFDALWNDDFHHSAMVAATGRREAYYRDHRGTPQEFVSAAKRGFLFQGQRYAWQGKRRGSTTAGVEAMRFVTYLQNHDQVANSARGERLHRLAAPGVWRALTALLLLGPQTPMLFQGQEFAASSPFTYFADSAGWLAAQVRSGRGGFMAQFPSLATPDMRRLLPDPGDEAVFRACVLDPQERRDHAQSVALHRDLLRLRREDPVLAAQGRHGIDGAVLGVDAFCLRWFWPDGDDRLLLVNLGADLHLDVVPEPLLAPPSERGWCLRWTSERPDYGGGGAVFPEREDGWRITACCALLLVPEA